MTLGPELPVLRKELKMLLRGAPPFWLLFSVVAGSVFLSLVNWPDAGELTTGRARAALFWGHMNAQRIAGSIGLLVLSATALRDERERGTWEILLATRLSAAEIVLSKLGSIWIFVAFVVLATMPSTAVFFLLGGVSFVDVVVSAATNALVLALVAAIGMLGAVWTWRLGTVRARTGVWIGVVAGTAIVLRAYGWLGPGTSHYAESLFMLGIYNFVAISQISVACRQGLGTDRSSALDLGHRDPRVLQRRWPFSFFTEEILHRSKRDGSRLDDPIFLRELYVSPFHRVRFRRLLFASFFTLHGLARIGAYSVSDGSTQLHRLALTTLILGVPLLVAPIFPREIRSRGLEAMYATPVTPRRLLLSKYVAALYVGSGLLGAALVWTPLDVLFRQSLYPVVEALSIVVHYAMACAVALGVGHVARTNGASVAASCMVLAAAAVGLSTTIDAVSGTLGTFDAAMFPSTLAIGTGLAAVITVGTLWWLRVRLEREALA